MPAITFDFHELTQPIQNAIDDFDQHADVNQMLEKLHTLLVKFIEDLVAATIQKKLLCHKFLAFLKPIAGKMALRFNGYKQTSIRLLSGQLIQIMSPHFKKVGPKKRGRKSKKRKAKSGRHLGLAYLGFIDRTSILLSSSVVQAALLCPSFEIAKQTLSAFGITIGVKTIQNLCRNLGKQAMNHRYKIALSGTDNTIDRILSVFIDGGRVRERIPKRGRKPANQKRQGYHTDWREPIQIVIEWLNADGSKDKDTLPLYDATLEDINQAFDMLESYLYQINITQADKVVFCADGARPYWKRFSTLAKKLDIKEHYEIIDYTHAKQNLYEIVDNLPKKMGPKKISKIFDQWKTLLWKGNLKVIKCQIREYIKSPKKYKAAMKKFKNYFLKNDHRMQYSTFCKKALPTGSGCVESAIRRVINLRLKSPGTFWKRDTVEVMLFLRSTLLCGRWKIMLTNLITVNRGGLIPCP
jgi:hypothetical protein